MLPIGATVSAFGAWSAARGAIVAPPSPLPGSHVVVASGGPEALDGQPGVPQSTPSYIVGAIVLLGLAAGLFWFGRCSSRPSARPNSDVRASALERRVDQGIGPRPASPAA